jgi:hypothetical protein
MQNITITEDLRNHVNTLCAESKAWAEAAPEGEYRGYASYDEEDLIRYSEHYTKGERCLTPSEWDQAKAWEEYMDCYKSENGIRPRWTNWSDETAEEWDRLSSECIERANAAYEAEKAEEDAVKNYEFESPADIANSLAINF